MFLGIVDLPAERREEFLAWGHAFSFAKEQTVRNAALGKVLAYLDQVIQQRFETPGDDLLSAIAAWRRNQAASVTKIRRPDLYEKAMPLDAETLGVSAERQNCSIK